jgi:hypothetical protein
VRFAVATLYRQARNGNTRAAQTANSRARKAGFRTRMAGGWPQAERDGSREARSSKA